MLLVRNLIFLVLLLDGDLIQKICFLQMGLVIFARALGADFPFREQLHLQFLSF